MFAAKSTLHRVSNNKVTSIERQLFLKRECEFVHF